MQAEIFTANRSGEIVLTTKGNAAFCPAPLPPSIDLGKLILLDRLLATAEAVAALTQAAQDINSPIMVASISNIFASVEARLSSAIEGIHTTTVDLLLAQLEDNGEGFDTPKTEANAEALNYINAIRLGQRRLADPNDIPICNRLIKDLHAVLVTGVKRGGSKNPGNFRAEQNAIGRPGDTEAEAFYVPPPPALMLERMGQLESFIHSAEGAALPVYVRAALVHYQFEAIHPFMDGNGRVGRLLIILMLLEASKLSDPLIYASAYYEAHQDEYYARLMRVSTHGEWEEWLSFFLTGIEVQAKEATRRIGLLKSLHHKYRSALQERNQAGNLLTLLDHLFQNPVVTAGSVERLGFSRDAAYRYIEILEQLGWLTATKPKGKRYRAFVALEILNTVEAG